MNNPPTHKENKEIIPKCIIIKLIKINDKEKILQATRENMACYVQQNKGKDDIIFVVRNNTNSKAKGKHL